MLFIFNHFCPEHRYHICRGKKITILWPLVVVLRCLERVLVGEVDGAGTRGHHKDVHDVGGNVAATIHQSHVTWLQQSINHSRTFLIGQNGTHGHHERYRIHDVGSNMAATIPHSHATCLKYHIAIHHSHANLPTSAKWNRWSP